MPGWGFTEYTLLILLAPLLAGSAFFSGSETALFGLTVNDRMMIRRRAGFASRTIESLLHEERMLLITILLGNMTTNVVFFVISSLLMLKSEAGWMGDVVLALGTLLVIVILGEVIPKTIANTHRIRSASLVAAPLLALHRLIGPIRIAVDALIVTPLNRLTAPPEAPPRLSADELRSLLEVSGGDGVIDADEQRLLRAVIGCRALRVREFMTPRMRVDALPATATHADVVELTTRVRRSKIPVYEESLDTIVGVLHVKRFLLDARGPSTPLADAITDAAFIPEVATLDRALDQFRVSGTQMAIVVDEYGGTAGLLAIEDMVEEIVGEIVGSTEDDPPEITVIGLNRWRIGGDLSVRDWTASFGRDLADVRATTVGGLLTERMGRIPEVGDTIRLANVTFTVDGMDGLRVATVVATLDPEDRDTTDGPSNPTDDDPDDDPDDDGVTT